MSVVDICSYVNIIGGINSSSINEFGATIIY